MFIRIRKIKAMKKRKEVMRQTILRLPVAALMSALENFCSVGREVGEDWD